MTIQRRLLALLMTAALPLLAASCESHDGRSDQMQHEEHTGMGDMQMAQKSSMDSAPDGTDASGKAVPPAGNPNPGYCPVMGGKIDKEKADEVAALHYDYEGKRYYFCCEDCKPKFKENPEKWIADPAKPQGEAGASGTSS